MPKEPTTRVDENGRVCTRCKKFKLWVDYHIDLSQSTGYSARCMKCKKKDRRECYSVYEIFSKYGITAGQYEKMFADQGGKCAICECKLIIGGYQANAATVDHCHTTQKIRGILCQLCNRGIGCLKHNPDFILNAHGYLTGENEIERLRARIQQLENKST